MAHAQRVADRASSPPAPGRPGGTGGPEPPPVPEASGSGGRAGLSPLGLASLTAVALVLVVVTVPRLFRFTRQENERDAIGTARLLAAALAAEARDHPDRPAGATPIPLSEVVERASLERELDDAEFLEGGQLMRRHGYLFARPVDAPGALLVAWPWRHGLTGNVALGAAVVRGKTLLLGHENGDGRWSGPSHWPRLPLGETSPRDAAGWRVVRR